MRLCFDFQQGTSAISAFELTFVRGKIKTAVMFPHLSVRKASLACIFLPSPWSPGWCSFPRGCYEWASVRLSLYVCRCGWNVEIEVDRMSLIQKLGRTDTPKLVYEAKHHSRSNDPTACLCATYTRSPLQSWTDMCRYPVNRAYHTAFEKRGIPNKPRQSQSRTISPPYYGHPLWKSHPLWRRMI
jgi:hypothetical protein